MNKKEIYFKSLPWSWKEPVFLLAISMILVPVFIEKLLMQALTGHSKTICIRAR